MRSKITTFLLLLLPIFAFGQQTNKNPYAAAAEVLRGTPAQRTQRRIPPQVFGTINKGEPVVVGRDLFVLPETAQKALDLSRQWSLKEASPSIDKQGRVLFAYGEGVPVLPCALLIATEVDLELGEEIVPDSLDYGDNRFEVMPRKSGQQAYLVIKPKAVGLDTTMIIGTNRRPYYIRLISTQHDYVSRAAFSYPQDDQKRSMQALQAEQEAKKKAEALMAVNTIGPIKNANYEIKLKGRSAQYLRPYTVGDDGIHTFIQLSPQARRQGLPVPQIRDAKGPISPNYRWDNDKLIIDGLFETACLISGVGSNQQRACIINHGLAAKNGN